MWICEIAVEQLGHWSWGNLSAETITVIHLLLLFTSYYNCFSGHDAIVTLLKHYKRPQDESPCNEYSQPGGGMVLSNCYFCTSKIDPVNLPDNILFKNNTFV